MNTQLKVTKNQIIELDSMPTTELSESELLYGRSRFFRALSFYFAAVISANWQDTVPESEAQ
jgi:hypothetical protein